MGLISGFHHISMKCCGKEEYAKAINFYHNILGLPIDKQWEGGCMIKAGESFLEVFDNGTDRPLTGFVRHFAFAVFNVDECVEAARKAGYEVFEEPHDIEFATVPPYPARIAFVRGPIGEEVEFFAEI